jgi:hypothetical protein
MLYQGSIHYPVGKLVSIQTKWRHTINDIITGNTRSIIKYARSTIPA